MTKQPNDVPLHRSLIRKYHTNTRDGVDWWTFALLFGLVVVITVYLFQLDNRLTAHEQKGCVFATEHR